ncbi:DUF4105 domain-containing protein [[Pseudomonas] boreopolis]|uniref:DUF7844 domain-containing protein n=1 Tax=Xanthomonas boreopolis TaxID=86183 RepID=UPI003D9B0879
MIAPGRPPFRWLAGLLFCLPGTGWAQASLPLQLHAEGLTAEEAEASDRLVEQVADRLPARWREALASPIRLEWTQGLPAHVQGRAAATRIRLDRRLLHAWMALPAGSDPELPAAHAAMAALIHELAHVLDRSRARGLSRDPRLLDLAGWQMRPWRLGRGGNHFADRSPDRYELHDPAEFVAVNLEHFVLDPDYACRRPALWQWFAARVGVPATAAACDAALPFLQADNEDGEVSLLHLDPARVYQVDYLLAEGNEQPMSRWGHSMLRLVVCAPGRAPGPQCRMDLQYHRVISFRAFVGDLQISSWRGLTGSYPSRLFLLPLDQVVDEYTKIELRALSSVPLALDRQEIAALLERAARVHWNYDGRYYFIGNNCAVETWKLLHDGIPRLAAMPLSGITPNGLQRRLRRGGVLQAGVLDDHARAVRQGYYFESAQAHYQAMFDVVRAALPVPQRTLQDWFESAPDERRGWMAQADLRDSAALLLLEQAIRRRQEQQVREDVKRRLLRGRGDARDEVLGVLEQVGVLARPAAVLDRLDGYGIPQREEQAAAAQRARERSVRIHEEWTELRRRTRSALPAHQRDALAQVEDNLAFIGQRLRELNAGADVPGLPENP